MYSRLFSHSARSIFATTSSSTFLGAVAIGTGVGFAATAYGPTLISRPMSLFSSFRQPILNDSEYGDRSYATPASNSIRFSPEGAHVQTRSGLQRYFNYQQLTLGSMTGAVSGYIIGKLSKVIVAILVSGYLTTQFLYSRGIPIPGLTYLSQTAVNWGKEKISLQELLLEQPSFKVSFVSAFIVGAVYA